MSSIHNNVVLGPEDCEILSLLLNLANDNDENLNQSALPEEGHRARYFRISLLINPYSYYNSL